MKKNKEISIKDKNHSALKFFIILHSRKQRTNIYISFTAKQTFHV